jgi:hypothetical protein
MAPFQIAALEQLGSMGSIHIIGRTLIVTLFAVMAIKYVTDL